MIATSRTVYVYIYIYTCTYSHIHIYILYHIYMYIVIYHRAQRFTIRAPGTLGFGTDSFSGFECLGCGFSNRFGGLVPRFGA